MDVHYLLKTNDLVLQHKCKKEDTAVRGLFPHSKLQFYNVLYVGRLRLTTRSYSHGKKSDDSNILFRFNGTENFGRIRSIFVADDSQPILYVAHFINSTPLICNIDNSTKYEYSGIQIAMTTTICFLLVEVKDFIEKTVLFEGRNHHHCFFRFPNLIHSS